MNTDFRKNIGDERIDKEIPVTQKLYCCVILHMKRRGHHHYVYFIFEIKISLPAIPLIHSIVPSSHALVFQWLFLHNICICIYTYITSITHCVYIMSLVSIILWYTIWYWITNWCVFPWQNLLQIYSIAYSSLCIANFYYFY